MAGIGFQLRKMVENKTITSFAKSYGYAAILSAGPWLTSILVILMIGFFKLSQEQGNDIAYQLVITYAFAFASSVMVTGFIQLPFTRYIADRIYEQREEMILPSYFGALLVSVGFGLVFLVPLALYVFPDQSKEFIALVVYIFITMTSIWLANIIASSLKFYKEIFFAYLFIYLAILIITYLYATSVIEVMFIFLVGNIFLFNILSALIMVSYPSHKLLSFDFFKRGNFYWFLGFAGLFYSLAVWVDKFIFWYHPDTGSAILGKLHGSVVYDIPIFMAYLTITPGMALFFFRLEAYFSQSYDNFFDAVKEGGRLELIDNYKDDMSRIVRDIIRDVLGIQVIISIIIYIYTPQIFSFFHIPLLYTELFHIDMIGAQLQLGFMSVLAILFYLDKRRAAMWLSLGFLVLNGALTLLSIKLGPYYFGYGYAVSLLIVFIISLFVIKKTLEDIEYETFLLR